MSHKMIVYDFSLGSFDVMVLSGHNVKYTELSLSLQCVIFCYNSYNRLC